PLAVQPSISFLKYRRNSGIVVHPRSVRTTQTTPRAEKRGWSVASIAAAEGAGRGAAMGCCSMTGTWAVGPVVMLDSAAKGRGAVKWLGCKGTPAPSPAEGRGPESGAEESRTPDP